MDGEADFTARQDDSNAAASGVRGSIDDVFPFFARRGVGGRIKTE